MRYIVLFVFVLYRHYNGENKTLLYLTPVHSKFIYDGGDTWLIATLFDSFCWDNCSCY